MRPMKLMKDMKPMKGMKSLINITIITLAAHTNIIMILITQDLIGFPMPSSNRFPDRTKLLSRFPANRAILKYLPHSTPAPVST